MKTVIALSVALVGAGCSSVPLRLDVEQQETRRIESVDIQRLPTRLTYRELSERWGPACIGDPILTYRSKIEGLALAVYLGDPPGGYEGLQASIGDMAVVSMYFTDMRNFHLHAWGEHILPTYDPFAAPSAGPKTEK